MPKGAELKDLSRRDEGDDVANAGAANREAPRVNYGAITYENDCTCAPSSLEMELLRRIHQESDQDRQKADRPELASRRCAAATNSLRFRARFPNVYLTVFSHLKDESQVDVIELFVRTFKRIT